MGTTGAFQMVSDRQREREREKERERDRETHTQTDTEREGGEREKYEYGKEDENAHGGNSYEDSLPEGDTGHQRFIFVERIRVTFLEERSFNLKDIDEREGEGDSEGERHTHTHT